MNASISVHLNIVTLYGCVFEVKDLTASNEMRLEK
jgi:hypothetical protein